MIPEDFHEYYLFVRTALHVLKRFREREHFQGLLFDEEDYGPPLLINNHNHLEFTLSGVIFQPSSSEWMYHAGFPAQAE